jgi:Ca-activated chloride channel family protein
MNSRCASLVLLLMALGGYSGGQVLPTAGDQDAESYRIAVDVDLVVLHATVRDRKGRVVPDLRQQDLEVYEDGVRQSIRLFKYEDIPVTVGLVVDHSGSMRPKLAQVIFAGRRFAHSSNPDDQMFVVNFNENVSLGLRDDLPFTHSAAELEGAISKAPADGMTALYDAIVKALAQLQLGNLEKKVLLVISDGADTASKHKLADVLKQAEQSSAIIYTIGLSEEGDPDRNPGVLKRLAHETGGEAYFPAQLDEVVAVCESIARDIRTQYTIGYFSSTVTPKKEYRGIRVAARAAGRGRLSVRTRAGYMAGGESPPPRSTP